MVHCVYYIQYCQLNIMCIAQLMFRFCDLVSFRHHNAGTICADTNDVCGQT